MKRAIIPLLITVALALAGPALAWGDLGHEVIALIAYRHLTPAATARVDHLLASDPDSLTAQDIASRATWADKYSAAHPGTTGSWHFANIELDHPDLSAACFGFPPTPPGQPASQGPPNDCVVDKINEFSNELKDPATPEAERLLALKFILHFVGDLHQPLHAADNHDRGGNCVALSPSPDGDVKTLHVFWDVTTVNALGVSADKIATALDAKITPAQIAAWSAGGPADWAMESFALAKLDAYNLPSPPTCGQPGSIALAADYQATADADAARQLSIAGIRLAYVLNKALAPS